jgi:putative tryptophan/tyrosine transport system substrate-binding protein
MRRREFITVLGGAAAWPLVARGQQAGKIYRIGFLANDPTIPTQPAWQVFLDGLHESGFIEGKNVIIERRFAEGRLDRYADLVAELVRLKVDVIVTSANEATRAAKHVSSRIPVVMMNVGDPLGEGIVENLAHPTGNITGLVQDDSAEIAAKRMQLLKDVVPRSTQLAVLLNPDLSYGQAQWQQLELAARSLNVMLRRLEARKATEIEGVFATIGQNRPDALFLANAEVNFVNRRLIVELAAKARLPTMSNLREITEAGGLMSYGSIRTDSFRRAAIYVGKILKGTKPADLPVEQPTKYELVINLKLPDRLISKFPVHCCWSPTR